MNMIKKHGLRPGKAFLRHAFTEQPNLSQLSEFKQCNSHTMHHKYYLRILSLFQNCDKILENTGGGVSNCINVKIKVLENVGGAKVQM